MGRGNLPLLATGRALVPGTRMAVHVRHLRLRAGRRVVAVLEMPLPGRTAGRVGTVARLDGVRHLAAEDVLVRLDGERLARIEEVDWEPEMPHARFCDVDPEGSGEGSPLVAVVQSALRRYMAVLAEAGEGGNIHVRLSRDAVAVSHQVASLLRVSWPEVQEILEAGGAAERLQRSLSVLERETGLLSALLSGEGR